MKLSMLTILFPNHSLEDCFRILSEQGYDGIEIWGARPHAYAPDLDGRKIEEILALKEKYGLEISMYTPELLAYPYNLVSADERERRETLDYLKRAIAGAAAMGTDRVQVTCGHYGPHTPRRQAWEWLTEEMKDLAEAAEKEGIDLIVEALTPCESNMILRCDDVAELKDRVGSGRIRTMIDLVPPAVMSEELREYFEKLPGDVDFIHCIDSDGVTYRHLMPGEGEIAFPQVLELLGRMGYDGWLSGELTTFGDKELCSAAYLARMRAYLAEGRSR